MTKCTLGSLTQVGNIHGLALGDAYIEITETQYGKGDGVSKATAVNDLRTKIGYCGSLGVDKIARKFREET